MYSIYKLTVSLLLFRSEGSISVQVTVWECPLHGILIVVACPRHSTFIGHILRDDELLKCDRRSRYYRPHWWTMNVSISAPCLSRQLGGHLNYCLFVRSNRVLPFTYVTSSSEHPPPSATRSRICLIYFQTDFCVFSTLFIPFEFTWYCLFELTANITVKNTRLLFSSVLRVETAIKTINWYA